MPHSAAIRPHATCHIVACAEQDVGQVRAPSNAAHRVLVARQHGNRPRARRADVESANSAVNARSRQHAVAVFIPIVRQGLAGRDTDGGRESRMCLWRRVDRDAECQVV